jgi:hypothetical protein
MVPTSVSREHLTITRNSLASTSSSQAPFLLQQKPTRNAVRIHNRGFPFPAPVRLLTSSPLSLRLPSRVSLTWPQQRRRRWRVQIKLNGVLVTEDEPLPLRHGDEIRLCEYTLRCACPSDVSPLPE